MNRAYILISIEGNEKDREKRKSLKKCIIFILASIVTMFLVHFGVSSDIIKNLLNLMK